MTEYLSTNPVIAPRAYAKTEQSGHVDFMLQHRKKLVGLEVKSALKLNQKHLTTLEEFKKEFPESELILCNLGKGGLIKKSGGLKILNIPAYAVYALFAV